MLSSRAAACMAATSGLLSGRPGFHSTVAAETFGNASLSSARRLALRSSSIPETPVTLPPGFARLFAKPAATGSPVAAMTIGIVFVNLTAAFASGVQAVTMTSTLESTSPRMMASSFSGLPLASWVSMTTVLPSIQPSSRSRSRKASA